MAAPRRCHHPVRTWAEGGEKLFWSFILFPPPADAAVLLLLLIDDDDDDDHGDGGGGMLWHFYIFSNVK